MKSPHLTPTQIKNFNLKGFAFLPGFLLPQRIEEVRDWTQQVIDWPELPGKYMKYYEDDETNTAYEMDEDEMKDMQE